ncbi:MAG TPA: VWA domain-containing protein [Roseiflexaceae bacterium]|nr:VWA domain-containing protein [Gemmataceae bacterium]
MTTDKKDQALARWRLLLGRFADDSLGTALAGKGREGYRRMDRVLEYLYGREYAGRGVREGSRGADLSESVLAVPEWLRDVRDLFPGDTAEVIERHALDRYGMTELVTDEEVLRKLEPSYELLKAVLTFRHLMEGKVLQTARQIVRKVVEELRRRLAKEVRPVLWGRLNRLRRSRLKVYRNLDWHRTIRANLKNYDRKRRRLILEALHFFSRVERHMPWHIILVVDCSGSMMDSVIYSAVMAGIFKGLPSLRVSLIAFDTSIIDLSDQVDDPTELLMSVQLGGGTDIGGALCYCETRVQNPQRTVVVLVTDFYEGGPATALLASIKRLREAGARVLGLAALDERAEPAYDRQMAERCVAAGAEVAALTPSRLAEWLAKVLS